MHHLIIDSLLEPACLVNHNAEALRAYPFIFYWLLAFIFWNAFLGNYLTYKIKKESKVDVEYPIWAVLKYYLPVYVLLIFIQMHKYSPIGLMVSLIVLQEIRHYLAVSKIYFQDKYNAHIPVVLISTLVLFYTVKPYGFVYPILYISAIWIGQLTFHAWSSNSSEWKRYHIYILFTLLSLFVLSYKKLVLNFVEDIFVFFI